MERIILEDDLQIESSSEEEEVEPTPLVLSSTEDVEEELLKGNSSSTTTSSYSGHTIEVIGHEVGDTGDNASQPEESPRSRLASAEIGQHGDTNELPNQNGQEEPKREETIASKVLSILQSCTIS